MIRIKMGQRGSTVGQAFGGQGHGAQAEVGGGENGVAHGRRDADNGRLPGPGGGNVLAVQEHDFDFGQVGEARDAVVGEARVGDLAVFKFNGLEQSAAQAHDEGAFDLVFEMVGIDHRAAIKGADGAEDLDDAALLVGQHFDAGGQVRAFLGADGQAEAAAGFAFGGAPAEGGGGGLQDVAQAGVAANF